MCLEKYVIYFMWPNFKLLLPFFYKCKNVCLLKSRINVLYVHFIYKQQENIVNFFLGHCKYFQTYIIIHTSYFYERINKIIVKKKNIQPHFLPYCDVIRGSYIVFYVNL